MRKAIILFCLFLMHCFLTRAQVKYNQVAEGINVYSSVLSRATPDTFYVNLCTTDSLLKVYDPKNYRYYLLDTLHQAKAIESSSWQTFLNQIDVSKAHNYSINGRFKTKGNVISYPCSNAKSLPEYFKKGKIHYIFSPVLLSEDETKAVLVGEIYVEIGRAHV